MAIKLKDQDPREAYPQPPFPDQSQEYPGLQLKMTPLPDDGRDSYQGSGKLEGKTALITGGDSGIGRSIAIAYAKEGADIVFAYLSEDSDAEETKNVVEKNGKKCIAIKGDIQDKSHCDSIVKRTIDAFGKVDILINNAAYQMSHKSIMDFTPESLDRHFHTNLYPLFYFCQACMPHMQPGSSVISTTSIQAYQPSQSLIAYAMTKAAILNFTKSFAQEAIQKGIRVNAVAPGPVWTPLIPSTMQAAGESKISNFGKQSMFTRPAQPIELATLYVFLASNDANYVTGQVYGATGEGMP